MKFCKMHGVGNDFILINGFKDEKAQNYINLAKHLCNRHFGIGADGLVIVLPSQKADVRMRYINSNGSEGEMCGNALRCFSQYVYEKRYVKNEQFTVETLAGIMVPKILLQEGCVIAVTVDMGEPFLDRKAIPMLGVDGTVIDETLKILDREFKITALLVGVPHCVIFVDDVSKVDLRKYGPIIENHSCFPNKVNVHFIEVVNKEELNMRVWERGAGVTLACGTGACASLVAAVLNGKVERKAKVHLPGGALNIEWASNNHIYMTGSSQKVFSGQFIKEVLKDQIL